MAEEVVSNGKQSENGDSAISDLEEGIIRQIEYYFGDINLPKDKFLKEQIALDDGWVPYSTMLKFKRLSNLTTDPAVITAALVKSKNQLLEVSEDGEKIRRSPEFPPPEFNEDRRKELMTRTIYVKGFPKEETTLDDCLNFFKDFKSPENVIMRRYLDKATKKYCFKGSVFVTFKTKEDAESFVEEKTVKYNDVELIKKWQSEYLKEKQAEYELKTEKMAKKKAAKEADKNKKDDKPPIVLPKGSVIILQKVPNEINREAIKEAITKLEGEVAFIKIENEQAWIRLQKEDTAKTVFEKFTEGKITIENTELAGELPDTEVEQKFLDEMSQELMQRQKKYHKHKDGNKNFNRKRRGAGGGGPHNKRR